MTVRELTVQTHLVVEHCYSCGTPFGIGAQLQADLIENHRSFYCPMGHAQQYAGKTAVQRAREERDAARDLARRESERRRIAEQYERQAEYRRRAAKGQLTKIRNRLAAGLCPCCGQHFPSLEAHLADKHPDFVLPPEISTEEG
jgi:hypothetical protein